MDPGEGGGLEQLVIEAKLRVPAPRSDVFSRSPLIERAIGSNARVVSVVAPAGYGKSTLLTEWAVAETRHAAWIRMDVLDDDPAVLLSVLARACAGFLADPGRLAVGLAQSGADPLGRGAPLLAAALRRPAVPFVLFVDDVHQVSSDACGDLLDVVLAAVPDGSAVVLASRHALPYLARQRISGHAFEIGTAELRLDTEGARRIAEEAGFAASDREIREWIERCDGWPTGLFLCAVIARDGRSLHGSDRRIADYLYRECLAGLPDGLRDFVLRSSVLTQLSASACNAVMEIGDAARRLRELEERNLFLIAVDGRRGWYRYHDLFREFLLNELETTCPGASARLHTRAADWHEAKGQLPQAVEHAFGADDALRAAGLVAETGLALYQRGEVALLERWLERLGDRTLEKAPWTTVIAAWAALLQGAVPDAVRWTALLERIEVTGPAEELVLLDSQRAMIRAAMCTRPVAAGLADAEFAVRVEPSTSPWRDQALHLRGLLLVLAGRPGEAREALVDASHVARGAGNADSILLSESDLAGLAIAAGDWGAARRHADAAMAVVSENHMDGYGTSANPYALGARIAVQRGELASAERLLVRGMRARERATFLLPTLAVQSRTHLAYAWLGLGDRRAAQALLAEIDEVLAHRAELGTLVTEVDELRTHLRSDAIDMGSVPLTPAELRLVPYLQTYLTLAEIGGRLAVSRNTVNSQAASIYRKLGVSTRGAAVEEAARRGLLGL